MTGQSRVRAVVFDVGNVLYRWHPETVYATAIPDPAARSAFMRDVTTLEWHDQHDRGIPFAETSAALAARFPRYRALIARWGSHFNEGISPLPGMAALVGELAAADVPLYAITNFSAEFWAPFVAQEAALFAPFRDIVVSGAERLVKPDPAIYALALARFGIAAADAIFVDDRAENVAGAEDAGMTGHLFVDAATLRARLAAIGLLRG